MKVSKLLIIFAIIAVILGGSIYYYNSTGYIDVKISGNSMSPSYADGQVVKTDIRDFSLERFSTYLIDINSDDYSNSPYDVSIVKRLIGLPGEDIEYKDNSLYIDGTIVEDKFNFSNTADFNMELICDLTDDVECNKIPDDYYLVLGDNRSNSMDSDEIGLIHKSDIRGKLL